MGSDWSNRINYRSLSLFKPLPPRLRVLSGTWEVVEELSGSTGLVCGILWALAALEYADLG